MANAGIPLRGDAYFLRDVGGRLLAVIALAHRMEAALVTWVIVLLLCSGCSPVAAAQTNGAASPDAAAAHPDAGVPTSGKACPSTMVFIRAGTFRMGSKDAKKLEFQVEGNPMGLSEEPITRSRCRRSAWTAPRSPSPDTAPA